MPVDYVISCKKTGLVASGFLGNLKQSVNPEGLESIQCETLVMMHIRFDESILLAHARSMISKARLEVLHNKWRHMLWMGENGKRPA